jgi:peroxiredoxin
MDALPSNKAFAEKIGVTAFPLLSDWSRDVTKSYGLFGEKSVYARRGTFVVDKEGKIQQIVVDGLAIDPTSTADACSLLEKKLVVAPPKTP